MEDSYTRTLKPAAKKEDEHIEVYENFHSLQYGVVYREGFHGTGYRTIEMLGSGMSRDDAIHLAQEQGEKKKVVVYLSDYETIDEII